MTTWRELDPRRHAHAQLRDANQRGFRLGQITGVVLLVVVALFMKWIFE